MQRCYQNEATDNKDNKDDNFDNKDVIKISAIWNRTSQQCKI